MCQFILADVKLDMSCHAHANSYFPRPRAASRALLHSGRRLAVFEITNMRVLDTLVFPLFHARLCDRAFKAQDKVTESIRPSLL